MVMALTCPATRCRAPLDSAVDACPRCGTPLLSYARLAAHPATLFNRGLAAARGGRMREARDLFAAVVHWCPLDSEARNAYALACLRSGDKAQARKAWEAVLEASPRDAVALKGVQLLAAPARPAAKQATKGSRRR